MNTEKVSWESAPGRTGDESTPSLVRDMMSQKPVIWDHPTSFIWISLSWFPFHFSLHQIACAWAKKSKFLNWNFFVALLYPILHLASRCADYARSPRWTSSCCGWQKSDRSCYRQGSNRERLCWRSICINCGMAIMTIQRFLHAYISLNNNYRFPRLL